MKTWYYCILTFISINVLQGQIPQGNTWSGDYHIESQAQADAFIEQCQCTIIDGDLIITAADIIHLDSLYTLKKVQGSVKVEDNQMLENCDGLNELTSISKDFRISYNNNLTRLSKFNNLEFVGHELSIQANNQLKEIRGFDGLKKTEVDISIRFNASLEVLDAFNQLQSAELNIGGNHKLVELGGFNKLDSLVGLEIVGNSSMQKIISP